MTTDEYIEYLSENMATEGLVNYLKSSDFKSSLSRGMSSMFLDILDSLAANFIVLINNLRGYVIYKPCATLMESVIDRFDKMIDECTFNIDRLVQGLSVSDIANEISIFEAKSLTSRTAARIAIDTSLSELRMYDKYMQDLVFENEDHYETDFYFTKDIFLDYNATVALQQKMLKLQRKVRLLSKKIRLSLSNINTLKKYGIDKEYAEELLSINRNEIARMGTVVIATFGKIYLKPATKIVDEKDISSMENEARRKKESVPGFINYDVEPYEIKKARKMLQAADNVDKMYDREYKR